MHKQCMQAMRTYLACPHPFTDQGMLLVQGFEPAPGQPKRNFYQARTHVLAAMGLDNANLMRGQAPSVPVSTAHSVILPHGAASVVRGACAVPITHRLHIRA